MKTWMKWCSSFALTIGYACSSWALDVATATLPAAVTDKQLSIGGRHLRLPSGDWQLIARREGAVTSNGGMSRKSTTYQAYAVRMVDGKWRGSVYFNAPVSSSSNAGWSAEPCKDDSNIYKDDFNSGFRYPECLLVKKRSGHLGPNSTGIYEQAHQWFTQNKVALPSAVYEIAYYRYASNVYGKITVFLPRSQTVGDEPVIAWAQGLPEKLRQMIEGRIDDATLPELPVKE
jgi:hypothetical protein